VMHGEIAPVVPVRFGCTLYETAVEPKRAI
jgi:hypothetical protein